MHSQPSNWAKVSDQLKASRVLSECYLAGKYFVLNGNQTRIPWSTSLLPTCWTNYTTYYIPVHIRNDLNSNGIYAHSIFHGANVQGHVV
jgi:hypothetical protein